MSNCVGDIKQKQRCWALSNNISFSDKGYVGNLSESILDDLDVEVKERLLYAGGYELRSRAMTLHSSSTLVANIFQYYKRKLTKNEDITATLETCSVNPITINYADFRVKFPISNIKAMLNLDIIFRSANDMVYDFESEFVGTYRKYQFTMDSYLQPRYQSIRVNLENIHKVSESEYSGHYCYLNYPQLLKHILRLKSELRNIHEFQLIYLWCDLERERSPKHRKGTRNFAELLSKDDIISKPVICQEIIRFLQQSYNVLGDRAYIEHITDRYLNLQT